MSDDVKIVMFCCNWCSYGGADTAGTARMQYPPNIRVIRVMCSGRIDPQFILKAFRDGADGVFVAGCHMGDCHYDAGNYKLDRRMRLVYKLVEDMGIGKERVCLDNLYKLQKCNQKQVLLELFTVHSQQVL